MGDTYGAGLQSLKDWAAGLEGIKEAMDGGFTEDVKEIVLSGLQSEVSEGKEPGGSKWEPKKEDGSRALKNAAAAMSASTVGNSAVIVELDGIHSIHHYGTGRMTPRAQLPQGGLPDKIGNAIRLGFITMCDAFMTRKGRSKKKGKYFSGSWTGK